MTYVCPSCFGDRPLQRTIADLRRGLLTDKCSFHPRNKGLPIRTLTEVIDEVFRENFKIGDFDYDEDGIVTSPRAGDSLAFLIGDITGATDPSIVTALVDDLIENEHFWLDDDDEGFFYSDLTYIRNGDDDFVHDTRWKLFCNSVVHGQRFFNSAAKDYVSEIFDEIHLQRDDQRNPVVYLLEPGKTGSSFFRCRLENDPAKRDAIAKSPEQNLGPPPSRVRRPGRMNPAGIAALYAAYSMDTCIAELRPPVGSVVVGARFDLVRPICVLDTTRFQRPVRNIGMFEKAHRKRLTQWTFMQRFRSEIAKPILPDDEYLDYIPTQAVAEYLCHHHRFKLRGVEHGIDAIIFQSAQDPEKGKNIVLLGGASAVRKATTTEKLSPDPFRSFEVDFDENFTIANPAVGVDRASIDIRRIYAANIISVAEPGFNVGPIP